jgi:hypothetical protein
MRLMYGVRKYAGYLILKKDCIKMCAFSSIYNVWQAMTCGFGTLFWICMAASHNNINVLQALQCSRNLLKAML